MFASALFAAAIVLFLYSYWKRTRYQPPGPWGLPIVGNFFQMDASAPYVPLEQWARRYGSVYQLHEGARATVIVSEPEQLRSLLAMPEVTARPDSVASRLIPEGRSGISHSDGETWGETHKILVASLAALGNSATPGPIETVVNEMTNGFLNTFMLNNVGREVQLGYELETAVMNTIWWLLTSEKFAAEDDDVRLAVRPIQHAKDKYHVLALADEFPFAEQLVLRLLPPQLQIRIDELTESLVGPTVERHRKALEANKEIRDFITAYLKAAKNKAYALNETHLMHTVVDILVSGTDPTVATLEWAICFLCGRSDVQEKLQQEVDAVVGSAPPRLAHLSKMPFTAAFIMETLRRGDITPLAHPHSASKDIEVGGYRVSRGSRIVPLLRAVHFDPDLFPEPLTFRPERFLDATGRLLPSDSLLPFLTGRRQCPGEPLARAQVFFTITALMRKFTLKFAEGFTHDHHSRCDHVHVRRPKPFRFVPHLRSEM